MKRLSLIPVLLLICLISASCSKEDDGAGTAILPSITAKVDGANWSAITRVTIKSGNTFVITATSISGEVMLLTINGTQASSYLLDALNGTIQFEAVYKPTITSLDEDNYFGSVGQLTLEQIDINLKEISGTFAYDAKKIVTESKEISNGIFTDIAFTDAKLQPDGSWLLEPKTGSMSCTIDSSVWVSITRITIRTGGTFIITASSATGDVILITIFGTSTGTYIIDPQTLTAQFEAAYKPTAGSPDSENFIATLGSLNILNVDESGKTLSGNFAFRASRIFTETKSVTEGRFSRLHYTE